MKKKRIYLDLCVFNRPFDDQKEEKIFLETDIFIYILHLIEKGIIELVISEVLIYENTKNPYEIKKQRIFTYFQLAKKILYLEEDDYERAKFLKKVGFKDIDALHISIAERFKIDYFITCDEEIIKLAQNHRDKLKIKILSLVDFIKILWEGEK